MLKKRRNYNTRLIKSTLSYDVNDIAGLYGLHKNTVRQWFREGLKKNEERKPYLVHGSELKRFLNDRQSKRKQKCMVNELFCCKCQSPRKTVDHEVNIRVLNQKCSLIMGICEVCKTKTNKLISNRSLLKLPKTFKILKIHNEHLLESDYPINNTN